MDKRVRSCIYFEGSSLRYAEIERSHSAAKLHRLGSCAFDFDAESAVFSGSLDHVAVIREALADVFSGTKSKGLSIVVPPGSCVDFYAPISAAMAEGEKRGQLEREARLVSGHAGSMAVTTEVVSVDHYRDEELSWHHVAAMADEEWQRIRGILSVVDGGNYRYYTRLQSAAAVASAQIGDRIADDPYVLIGRKGRLTELGVMVDGKLRTSHVAAVTDSKDVCYHALAELQSARVRQGAIREVLFFGDAEPEIEDHVRSLVAPSVAWLNPLSFVSNAPAELHFDPAQYVHSIGGAL